MRGTPPSFDGNNIIVNAGMMAETYGVLPHKVLQADNLLPMDRFTLDLDVMEATNLAKERMDDNGMDPNSPGSASSGQFRELAQDQNRRAEQREAMESGASPDPDEQIAGLRNLQNKAEAARNPSTPERNTESNGSGGGSGNIGPR